MQLVSVDCVGVHIGNINEGIVVHVHTNCRERRKE